MGVCRGLRGIAAGTAAPTVGFLAVCALLLAGCGQKGPLYRPEKAPQPEGQESAAADAAETLNPTASSD